MIGAALREFWPPAGQRQLLEAATAPPDKARAAWRQWAGAHDIEDATWFEARLFASLAPRLATLMAPEDVPARLQGLRRYVWVRTQRTLMGAKPLLAAFHAAEVRMMPLKGAARHAAAGADQPSRCLTDIDLLIHPDHWARAVAVAYRDGWRYVNGPMGDGLPLEAFLHISPPFHHSFCFKKDDVEVDLHHLALFMSRDRSVDAGIWARGGEGRLSGVPVEVPSVTDQLFVTLAHALLYGPEPSGDWMLDAAALIAQGGVDWSLLESETIRRALEPSIAVPLGFLSEATDLPIPPAVIARLAARFRAPFLQDFISHATGYRPETPERVDAVRDAAAARAAGPVKRPAVRRTPGGRRHMLLDERPRVHPGGNTDRFEVPLDLPEDAMTRVELTFRVGRTAAAGHPMTLDLWAPGMILKRWSTGGRPIQWWQRRVVRLTFDLPAALLARRQIEWFGIQLRDATLFERLPVRDLRLRWSISGRLPAAAP